MNHLIFVPDQAAYPVCFLVPTIRKDEIERHYLAPSSIDPKDVLVLDLHYEAGKKKTSVTEMRKYIDEHLVEVLTDGGVQYCLVADSEYFKALTGAVKTEANLGYVLPGKQLPNVNFIYVPNYKAVFYDPIKVTAKIRQGLQALADHRSGTWQKPGHGIISFAAYPRTNKDIGDWLERLLAMDVPLTIDIEAFDLKHTKSGIGTISFAWSKSEGIAFPVDYVEDPWVDEKGVQYYGKQVRNEDRRIMLRVFFEHLKKTATYHNISFDVYALIYQLYMKDILDTEGLLRGMEIMLRDWDDTKLITYLATNSCAGNKLGLKDQAQEYAGNYAVDDIVDIRKIPLDKLLEYNLVDSLSTWYTKEKHWDRMVNDQQHDIYVNLFKPATLDIIQMQLTGMPLNMVRVKEVKAELQIDYDKALASMRATKAVQRFEHRMGEKWVADKNATLKKKRVTIADWKGTFNPNSPDQLQDMLFKMLALPVLGYTDSKQPATGGDIIKNLRNHTNDPDILAFLNGLVDYKAVDKILTSFIPAMENATLGPDGWHYLFGNFNLGGTLSGRLSSSDPNLQNLPASSKYAKKIKSCFQAPPGWMFCGLDFASLEDRISGLTTKDPNKLKVYTDGYDGHCLRAFAYFGDQMPGIVDTVASINTIEKLYKPLRQESKAPTFALTYQGTYITLMKNCGFSKEKALMVEQRYKELYKVSIDWVAAKLDQASKDGYVTAAFGLRVRTPLLHQVIRGNGRTPYEAEAEGRSAGNALGQSWCLLNSRASAEFMGGVRQSEYRLDIRPCAHIHDAQYMLVRDDIGALMYANKHLVDAVEWQAHPDIAHPDVKLGGEFSIFYPSWVEEIGIPKGASEDEVFAVIDKAMS